MTEKKNNTVTEDAYKVALEQNKELSKLYEKELVRNKELSKYIDENKAEIQSLKDKLEIAENNSKQALKCMNDVCKHNADMFFRRVISDNRYEMINNIMFLIIILIVTVPGIILLFR